MPGSDGFEEMRARHLARHAERKGGPADRGGAAPTGGGLDPHDPLRASRRRRARGGSRGAIAVLLVGGVGAGLFGLTQVKGASMAFEPPAWMAAAASAGGGMVGMDGSRAPRAEPPPMRVKGAFGWTHRSPSIAHASDAPLEVHAVLAGLPRRRGALPEAVPAAVETLPQTVACAAAPPAAGARVRGVRMARAERSGGVTVVSDRALASQVTINAAEVIGAMHKSSRAKRKAGQVLAGREVPVADVVVTDTAGPLHLALEATSGPVIWNLHLAPGVTLAGVTLVARSMVGIAGQGAAPVEALRPAPGCIQGVRDAIPDEGLVQPHQADHVLVGPAPDAPVPYTPLAERTVALTAADHVLTGKSRARKADLRALHEALLARAAGGDLAALDPEPVVLGETR